MDFECRTDVVIDDFLVCCPNMGAFESSITDCREELACARSIGTRDPDVDIGRRSRACRSENRLPHWCAFEQDKWDLCFVEKRSHLMDGDFDEFELCAIFDKFTWVMQMI